MSKIKMQYQSSLILMSLHDWSFITVTGVDIKKFLQNQLTCDIDKLSLKQHILTAHCNAFGKMWSTLRLFHYQKGFGYILRNSVITKQLNAFKKYAIFSQITFNHRTDILLLGAAGPGVYDVLSNFFLKIPDNDKSVIHFKETSILYFNSPCDRFLIITNCSTASKLIKYFPNYASGHQWLAFDIAAGIANIDVENSELFIPQAVNLQLLSGSISFQKGCYLGQEVISRTEHRGVNKRAMYCLTGTSKILPKTGENIKWKIGNNWRHIGTILAAVRLTDTTISLQVIMNKNMPKDSVFSLSEKEKSELIIQPLPYLLSNS